MAEDGWDRVAEYNVGLCGCNWWIFPFRHKSGTPRPHFKDQFPADCWEVEPITLYLAHDKCLFYSHNLGAFVDSPPILAWSLASEFKVSIYSTFITYGIGIMMRFCVSPFGAVAPAILAFGGEIGRIEE